MSYSRLSNLTKLITPIFTQNWMNQGSYPSQRSFPLEEEMKQRRLAIRQVCLDSENPRLSPSTFSKENLLSNHQKLCGVCKLGAAENRNLIGCQSCSMACHSSCHQGSGSTVGKIIINQKLISRIWKLENGRALRVYSQQRRRVALFASRKSQAYMLSTIHPSLRAGFTSFACFPHRRVHLTLLLRKTSVHCVPAKILFWCACFTYNFMTLTHVL